MKWLILTLLYSGVIWAQTQHDDKAWLGLIQKKQMDGYHFWQEIHLRFEQETDKHYQTALRFGPSFDYKTHEIGLLFAYVQTGDNKEWRPTLQQNKTYNNFTNRNRLEIRKLENQNEVSLRYRSLFRIESSQFIIWDEPFINLTREQWTGNRLLDKNRFFAGIKINANEWRTEVGYMYHYIPNKQQTIQEHILALMVFY